MGQIVARIVALFVAFGFGAIGYEVCLGATVLQLSGVIAGITSFGFWILLGRLIEVCGPVKK